MTTGTIGYWVPRDKDFTLKDSAYDIVYRFVSKTGKLLLNWPSKGIVDFVECEENACTCNGLEDADCCVLRSSNFADNIKLVKGTV